MNDLSWIIFWADVAPQISNAICYIAFLLMIITGFIAIIGLSDSFGDARYNSDNQPENSDARLAIRCRKLWFLPVLFLTLWVSSFMVPSDKETYYAIAASEVGEEILKTPEVGKARQALNNWLDEQITDEKETTDDSAQ